MKNASERSLSLHFVHHSVDLFQSIITRGDGEGSRSMAGTGWFLWSAYLCLAYHRPCQSCTPAIGAGVRSVSFDRKILQR